ncbi:MAG: L-lactate permease [Anaerolineae bacterium]
MRWLDLLFALLPILSILILMLGLRWKSTRAGMVSWALALLVAWLRFGAGPRVLWWAQVRGFFLAAYVLYIIWGALLFYRVSEATGTIAAMGDLIHRLSPNRAMQALLLAWGLASFLQGVGGFGVPVAVVAPLLAGMGFPLMTAVVMPSLGHAWAVSFGSLGSSFFALMAATGLPGEVLAPWSAVHLGAACLLLGAATLWAAGGAVALRQACVPWLLMGAAMGGVQWLAAQAGLWNIAAMLGSLAGLILGGLWSHLQAPQSWSGPEIRKMLRTALIPYGLLLGLIFLVKLTPALQARLDVITLKVQVPALETTRGWTTPAGPTRSISLLGHTGALLIYGSLLTLGLGRHWGTVSRKEIRTVLGKVGRSGLSSTLGILSMVALASTMEHAGMITLLAREMATVSGALLPLISPFIGALGAFVTGSNTNSNVLFAALQQEAAQTLRYPVALILAAQNAGAAIGSTFAPAKIIVGCSTVDLEKGEGETIRRLLRYDVPVLIAMALLTWGLTKI